MSRVSKVEQERREALRLKGLKRCTRRQCNRIQPHANFGNAGGTWDGLRSWCKDCRTVEREDYYAREGENVKARGRAAYAADPEKRAQRARTGRAYRETITQECATPGCTLRPVAATEGSICTRCIWRRDNWGTVDDSGRPEPQWRTGEDAYQWKGDAIGYLSAHARVYHARGRASEYTCIECDQQAQEWSYNHRAEVELFEDRPFPSGDVRTVAYSGDVTDYDPMCRTHHRLRDANRPTRERELTTV